MKTLDLDAVQTFALTASLMNFTRVAEATGTTQSAVSLKLKRLETFLGKRLFERTPRSVRLTDDGTAFLAHAKALLAANERALAAEAGPAERHLTAPRHGGGQRAQDGAHHRQGGHSATAHCRVGRPRDGQHRCQRESCFQRTNHERRGGPTAPATPASANVAIDLSVATAARSTGSASAAPDPSPSRMRRSRIGSNSRAAHARA